MRARKADHREDAIVDDEAMVGRRLEAADNLAGGAYPNRLEYPAPGGSTVVKVPLLSRKPCTVAFASS
jgi:hypothetical protein